MGVLKGGCLYNQDVLECPQTPNSGFFFLHARTLCSGEYVNGRNSKEYIETRMAENLKYKGAL